MNDEKIVYWKDVKWKYRKDQIIGKAKQIPGKIKDGAKNTIKWCEEHPELAITIMTTGTFVVGKTFKVVDDVRKSNSEKRYYDRSLGQNIYLKKKLTKAQANYAREVHMNTGKSYYEIYKDMNLV